MEVQGYMVFKKIHKCLTLAYIYIRPPLLCWFKINEKKNKQSEFRKRINIFCPQLLCGGKTNAAHHPKLVRRVVVFAVGASW